MRQANWFGRVGVSALAVVLAVLGTRASADELVLRDGRVLQGRVVRETDTQVVFDVSKSGSGMAITFQRGEVERVTIAPKVAAPDVKTPAVSVKPPEPTPRREGPAYFVIPIHGEFGLYVTDGFLQKALSIARADKPTAIILDINSPGGAVSELDKMLDTMLKNRDLRIVAYVHDAHSCGAIFAMSCKEIVMAPGGSIGGAVVFRMTQFGTPRNIEEKMQSILRAKFRSAAQTAGHEPLLVEGMMRADIHLIVKAENGKPAISEGNPLAAGVSGVTTIKPMGKIMTLTSKEAVDAGLALGLADSVAECNKFLSIPKWSEGSRMGEAVYKGWKDEVDAAAKRYKNSMTQARAFAEKATTSDPSRFTYVVRPGGEFTPESKRDWQDRSDKCTQLLVQAEGHLKTAATTATKNPEIIFHPDLAQEGYSADQLQEIVSRVKLARERILASRNRPGM